MCQDVSINVSSIIVVPKLKNQNRIPGWIFVTDKNSHWIRMADGPPQKLSDSYDYEFQVYNKKRYSRYIIMFYIF